MEGSESLELLRAVVGNEASDSLLASLLAQADNNVERAINFFYDSNRSEPTANGAAGVTDTDVVDLTGDLSTGEALLPPPGSKFGERTFMVDGEETACYYAGAVNLYGHMTVKGTDILRAGDELMFERNKRVAAPPGTSSGKRKFYLQSKPKDTIVRFRPLRGTHTLGVGKLPTDAATILAPLLDKNKVVLTGACTFAKKELSILDSVGVVLHVYFTQHAFLQGEEELRSVQCGETEANTMEGDLKEAMVALVMYLKLVRQEDGGKRDPMTTLVSKYALPTMKRSRVIVGAAVRRTGDDRGPVFDWSLESGGDPSGRPLSSPTQSDEGDEGTKKLSEMDVDDIYQAEMLAHRDIPQRDDPEGLVSNLRPYQQQALWWMMRKENLEDKKERGMPPQWKQLDLPSGDHIYFHSMTGSMTFEYPAQASESRGGILADEMGLGKTVELISLILANSPRCPDSAGSAPKRRGSAMNGTIFGQLKAPRPSRDQGGTLVVCPMSLLSQWASELETHCDAGRLRVYEHYGDRIRDADTLAGNDVVLTTYGVVASEYDKGRDSVLHNVKWYRVILDEAHFIKGRTNRQARSVFALSRQRVWAVTGTPLQNSLDDIFSLIHFIKAEPFSDYTWWKQAISRPLENAMDGETTGEKSDALYALKTLLQRVMLRRTKGSTDKEGNPIVSLPPRKEVTQMLEQSSAEKDFYNSLHNRTKNQFDTYVAQGSVMSNYANILELLLRLRQACDHPYLTTTRGDVATLSDLDKLKRALKGGDSTKHAYVDQVVDEIRSGEAKECPVCLEAIEDAVITPCAHVLCRECAHQTIPYGCPVCRAPMKKDHIVSVPRDNRFYQDLENDWQPSSKVTALLEELENLKNDAGGLSEKVVIFSQWTAMLDLLEFPLKKGGFGFCRLDGTMSQQKRKEAIAQFCSQTSKIDVFLLSLKAGGIGLNLTAASTVILCDPWWNPAVEQQALNRVHRIGQSKEVRVVRYIMKGTVEERMLQVQFRKDQIVQGALGMNQEDARNSRVEELRFLIGNKV